MMTWSEKKFKGRDTSDFSSSFLNILDDIADTGFNGIELWGRWKEKALKDLGSIKGLVEALRARQLAVAGIYFPMGEPATIENNGILTKAVEDARFLQSVDSEILVIQAPRRPMTDIEKHIGRMAMLLNEIGHRTADYGVKPALHPHYGSMIQERREIDSIMALTDPEYVYFAPDISHIFISGGDIMDTLLAHRERIQYFHFKDALRTARKGEEGFNYYPDLIVELGQGVIDLPSIMCFVKQIKYQGWITIDLNIARITPLQSLQICRSYIEEVLSNIYT